ncbi:unnamed protein product [Tilletia controversa]|uniref:Autophagy-related protein 9 n=1 Tax=Tilletia controversa TaxID=13291 RepID=A0A8X7SWK6_9BASI|nr:hypothetical protein CF328_g1120 [Tilletia controversa]KAE8247570.1 hypothetical protein A4X06_0g4354 [Tilletia controversa]CAD6981607.1 unnamed protein product [Tilletia controversa]
MDPFEDPDSVPGAAHDPQQEQQAPQTVDTLTDLAQPVTALSSAGPAPKAALSETPSASLLTAGAAAAAAAAAEESPFALLASTSGAADLHASTALFGEDAVGHDNLESAGAPGVGVPGGESVQLSALTLPPSAQALFADDNQLGGIPSADASRIDLEAQQRLAASSSAEPLESADSVVGAGSKSASHRHRHRRPGSSASGRRRRDNNLNSGSGSGGGGGGLSSTISSLRRNISRQIDRERQQMGLSKSNLRETYIPHYHDDDDDEDEDEYDDETHLMGSGAPSEDALPRPEDVLESDSVSRDAGPNRSSPAGINKSGPQRKGKARMSESRSSAAARRRNLDGSTASIGARRRAMRVMNPKEKALWLWANVENMDAFLAEVYAYYQGKGAYCIALSRTLNLLTIAFVTCFSTFLLGCVDYSAIKHDGLLSDVIVPQCVNHFSSFAVLLLFALGGGFVWLVFRFSVGISRLVAMHGFYEHLLGIPDADVQAIPWHEVVSRISALRISNPQDPSLAASVNAHAQGAAAANKKRLGPGLDAHDIANRIMRQQNYLIALFNKDVLSLNVPFQVPLPSFATSILGLNQTHGTTAALGKPKPVLTRSLEWNLQFCLLGFFFDQDGQLNQAVLSDRNRNALIAGLRKRFVTMAILNAILAPFIILYLLLFSFFRYFAEYHKNPANLGSRQYTEYARWKFREFNELPHLFKRRMQSSMPFAQRYTDQFPKERVVLLARFVAFIAGSFTAVLLLASLFDPDLFLHFDITPQRNTLFYIGIFGGVLAVARGMVPEESVIVDPESEVREVIRRTHYYPDEWRGRLHSTEVHADFGTMYMLKVYIFLMEMVSVIVTPFILWLSLPESAPAIVDFFREFTVHVDGLGYVCSFAVFDFKRHGNVRFGAPTESRDERMASKAGKMEQSFLNFKVANPDWLPADASGSLFLSRLTETVARHQQGPTTRARASGPMDPYASTMDPYATASYLHASAIPSGAGAGGVAESTLTARKHLYDEAFNRSILLASKPRNAEALAASAHKTDSRSAYRSHSGSGTGAGHGASAAAAAGLSGGGPSRSRSASMRARALQAVEEDGDLFGEQPEGGEGVELTDSPVDPLTLLPPRSMDDSALDAPFHSFVGEGDFVGVPSSSARGGPNSVGVSGGPANQGQGQRQGQQPGESPMDEQGFKALIGNLYRNGGQPAHRSVW